METETGTETETGENLPSAENIIIVVVEKEEDLDFNSDLNDFAIVSAFKL